MTVEKYGPVLPYAKELHAAKYREERESFYESQCRVAGGLADNEEHRRYIKEMFLEQRALPAGRVQNAIGSTRETTPYNCYVSGKITDSSRSIMERAAQAFETMRHGGGIGYGFSNLRPRGSNIITLGSKASGPVSFMNIYDSECETVASAGHRRGAQMAVLRVDHPDIEEFIRCKQPKEAHQVLWKTYEEMEEGDDKYEFFQALQSTLPLRNFNVSVGITDEFMEAVCNDGEFDLRFEGRTHRRVRARKLWDEIMRSTWDWAEPGVLFLDTINKNNNLWYCEEIEATNP